MPFQFTYPFALLLLPLLYGYFWWLNRHTVTDMSPGRKRAALFLRSLLATLLVFVLAGLKWVKKSESLAVVFVVDASRSVREDQQAAIKKYIEDASKTMRQVDKVGVITFARDAHVQSPIGPSLDMRLRDPGATTATDVEQALRQAKIELDSAARDSGKRIVLLSDGNENSGHALAGVRELNADRIVLDTVTLPVAYTKETLVEKMIIPPRVKIGEPFPVRVVVSSLTAQTATVALTREGKPVGNARRVELHPGKNVVVFEQNVDKPGFTRYGATLDAPDDTIAENNKGEGFVWVSGKPTVLYVADSPALTGFLRDALKSQNINVEYAPPEALPTSPLALQRFDSVFLSNVRADYLSGSQMRALQVSCRDFGVGFGMVGGENSFGAGGWRGTPIEDTLPVTMEIKKTRRIPSVAVALVIEDLEIPTTVNMSIEAAKATMDLLEPIDQVGVLDCNGPGGYGMGSGTAPPGGTWRIKMDHVTDKEALKSAMQGLTNMGDPPSYEPYLVEAARVLNNTDAKVKHIIFLGDGDAVYEANQGAMSASLRKIHDMGITVSTITTGATGQEDVKFMATLAYAGGGQSYVAEKPQDLPRLLLKDQQTISQPPIIEEPFHARPVEGDEILKGIDWGSAPPLFGYNISNLKPMAEASLLSHRGDLIFAGWRYGLGRSVAFTSDDRNKWSAAWIKWPGYSKFWAQAVRWTLRPFAPSDFNTQVVMENGRGHIIVDALDDKNQYVNKLDLKARIAGPSAGGIQSEVPTDMPLRQTGPGHYEGWFDAPEIGTTLVNVLRKRDDGKPDEATVLGLSTAYSPEYRDTTPNRYLMNQLAQTGMGRPDPPAASAFGGDRPGVFAATDITIPLLLAAMFLLPFDIATRRLALDANDFKRAVAAVFGRTPQPAKERSATPALGRLLDRKEGAVAGRAEELGIANDNGNGANGYEASPTADAIGVAAPTGGRPVAANAAATAPVRTPSRTLRPEGLDEAAPLPPSSDAPAAPPEPSPEEAGLSRLMAAKRRAQQRQEGGDDGSA